MKVLVAEDDRTSRILLGMMLRKWGYDPQVVEEGTEALEILSAPGAPRLVLLDWIMPGMDGVDVCRALREQEDPSDPSYVVLLTGRNEKSSIVEGLEAGANDYVTKPYDNEELRARLQVGRRMLDLQEALVRARTTLAHQARHDGLTGILNRRALLEELEVSLTSRGLLLALCDLDHFKRVNDTWGHQVGDEVLRAFASRLEERLGEEVLFGRYGGGGVPPGGSRRRGGAPFPGGAPGGPPASPVHPLGSRGGHHERGRRLGSPGEFPGRLSGPGRPGPLPSQGGGEGPGGAPPRPLREP